MSDNKTPVNGHPTGQNTTGGLNAGNIGRTQLPLGHSPGFPQHHQIRANGHPAGQNPAGGLNAGNIGRTQLPLGYAPGLPQYQQIRANGHPAGQNPPGQINRGNIGGFHHRPPPPPPPPPRAPMARVPRYQLVQQEGPFRGPMRYISRLGIVAPSSFSGPRFEIVQEPGVGGALIVQEPFTADLELSLAIPGEGSSRRGRGRPPGSRGSSPGISLVDSGGQQPSQTAPTGESSRRGRGRPRGSRGSSLGRNQVDSGEETGVGRPRRGRGRPLGSRKRRGSNDDGSPGGKHSKHDAGEPSSAV